MKTINRDKTSFVFSKDIPPVEHAGSGEMVRFQCQDCYCDQITEDGFDFSKLDRRQGNPATGPLYVDGAEPGDVLRIDVKKIDLASSGCACVREGAGIYEIEGNHCKRYPVAGGFVQYAHGIKVPIKPMIGVIGVAPIGGEESTRRPGEHGGNLDIKDLCEGTSIYLPVNVPGALLSMGDLHAVQGDGETVICALEMSGEVTVEVTLLKKRSDIPTPFLVTKTHYMTTAASDSLDDCNVKAARKMHRFLQDHSQLNDTESGLLLSMAGNLRISQVVNPLKGCIMDFPIGLANERFEG